MCEDKSTEVWVVMAKNSGLFDEYNQITIVDVYDNEDAAMDKMSLMMFNIQAWRKEGIEQCGDNDELWDKHWQNHPYLLETGDHIEEVFVENRTVLTD
jgi:hypothetical protein